MFEFSVGGKLIDHLNQLSTYTGFHLITSLTRGQLSRLHQNTFGERACIVEMMETISIVSRITK